MDFKSLISKLDSMEAPPQTPAAPVLEKAVQLNEDAQLRVLSGRSTYVSEAKKKAEEDVKEEKSSTGGEIDRSKKGVTKHTENPNRFSDEPHAEPKSGAKSKSAAEKKDAPEQKKSKTGTWGMEGGKKFDNTKKESIEPEFKSKFMKMVEAAKEESEADKTEAKKKKEDKKKKVTKAVTQAMDEGKKPDDDGDGVPDWADKKKGEDDNAGKKTSGKKGMSAAQAKYFGKKTESKMMPKGKKRPVKESIENILSFKDMIKLVQESGGQQQIDAVDQELFAWAQRVAKQKIGEGIKADVYAGMVYERMGGVFEMYDVLSEDQK
jgi:hypothetical protein